MASLTPHSHLQPDSPLRDTFNIDSPLRHTYSQTYPPQTLIVDADVRHCEPVDEEEGVDGHQQEEEGSKSPRKVLSSQGEAHHGHYPRSEETLKISVVLGGIRRVGEY